MSTTIVLTIPPTNNLYKMALNRRAAFLLQPLVPGRYLFEDIENMWMYYRKLGYGQVKSTYNSRTSRDLVVSYNEEDQLWKFEFDFHIRLYTLEFKLDDENARDGDKTMDGRPCKVYGSIAPDHTFIIKQVTEDGKDVLMEIKNYGRQGLWLTMTCNNVTAKIWFRERMIVDVDIPESPEDPSPPSPSSESAAEVVNEP